MISHSPNAQVLSLLMCVVWEAWRVAVFVTAKQRSFSSERTGAPIPERHAAESQTHNPEAS